MKNWGDMPDHARVWTYQAERGLADEEVRHILNSGEAFVRQWTSHGANLDASFNVVYNRIVLLSADEQAVAASGCGIDKSVHFMKDLSNTMGIDFFQRTMVLFKRDLEWEEAPLNVFWAMRKAMLVNDETLVLDTTVRTMGEVRSQMEKPFSKSWHAEMWGK
jgi:hypothetical protein